VSTRRVRRPARRTAVLCAATALIATGCVGSSGAGDPSTPTPDPFGSLSVGADQPIEIGTLLATSGQGAALGGQSLRGVQLAVDYLDGKLDGKPGKLLGHDVQLLNVDEGCTAEGGLAGAGILAGAPIAGVIGTTCSSAAIGAADTVLSRRGIMLVSPTNTSPELTAAGVHQPYYVRVAPNGEIQGAVVADFALDKLDAETAATLEDRDAAGGDPAAAFRFHFQDQGGTISGSATTSTRAYREGLTKVGGGKPDAVYYAAPEIDPSCGLLPREMASIPGLANAALVSSGGCLSPAFLAEGGSAADGTYVSGPDMDAIESGEFYKDEFAPAYVEQFGDDPQGPAAAYGFDAASVLFDAIVRAAVTADDGSLTMSRAALHEAVYATREYFGLTGTLSCTPLGDCASSATIAVYKVPDVPVAGGTPDASPAYVETKSLTDLIP
jgi:branched-chain amino acid transport system substrate-binding protein